MSYQGFPDWDKLTCDGIQIGIQDLQKTLFSDWVKVREIWG